MKRLTISLLMTLAVLLGSVGTSFALPQCKGSPADNTYNIGGIGKLTDSWSNCLGTETHEWNNYTRKYVGEYRNGKFHGKGKFIYRDGNVEEGTFKAGMLQKPNRNNEDATIQKSSNSSSDTVQNKLIDSSSGSGFSVSADGHVVTNHHVIDGCQEVKIHHKGRTIHSTIISVDPINDLALLKGKFRPSTVLRMSHQQPKLLQDIYVAGFPFGRGISASVKVTKGIISSLTGIGNDLSNMQIDAALQPGNSGGPILNERGFVVGVAVAKLDFKDVLKNFGAIPENTNFGIKAMLVRSMLENNNIKLPSSNIGSLSKSQLGAVISDSTYLLSCWMTLKKIEEMKSVKVLFKNIR